MAIQNPHSKELSGTQKAICIFKGPDAYISPAWYKTYPNVPTWNYAVVHVYGNPIQVDQQQLSSDLSNMVNHYESSIGTDYVLPAEYKEKLLAHIVGFKMEILHIEGKFKLGQNRSLEDQNATLEGLRQQHSNESRPLLDFIQRLSVR